MRPSQPSPGPSPAVAAALALGVLSTLAAGAPRVASAGGVVLESHVGARPADLDRLLSPVLDELAARGYAAGYEGVGRAIERDLSRPALSDDGLPAGFVDELEAGQRAWVAGRFEDAVAALTPVVAAAQANPGAFAQQPALRDRLLKAMVALALAQHGVGDADAGDETLGELLRGFPGATVPRGTYGADAAARVEQVRRDLEANGRGRMTITASDPAAAIFIDERFDAVGRTSRGDLLPGPYRVFAQVGRRAGRAHRVEVRPDSNAELAIDVGLDEALRTTPRWTGLGFDTPAARARLEAGYAARVATALRADAVVVLGTDARDGRAGLVGAALDPRTGQALRRARVALAPDPPVGQLRALGRYLAGEPAGPGLEVLRAAPGAPGDAPDGRAAPGAAPGRGPWPYAALGGAVAAGAIGVWLLRLDDTCASAVEPGRGCPALHDTLAAGLATLAGGAALGGLAAYLLLRAPAAPRAPYVAPQGGGAVVGLTGRF